MQSNDGGGHRLRRKTNNSSNSVFTPRNRAQRCFGTLCQKRIRPVTSVTFPRFRCRGRLVTVKKLTMRRRAAAALLTLLLGAVVFSPSLALAQDQPEAKRKIVSKVLPVD